MKEKNTQGIDEETATKNNNKTNKTADDKKLVDLRAGLLQSVAGVLFGDAPVAFKRLALHN